MLSVLMWQKIKENEFSKTSNNTFVLKFITKQVNIRVGAMQQYSVKLIY